MLRRLLVGMAAAMFIVATACGGRQVQNGSDGDVVNTVPSADSSNPSAADNDCVIAIHVTGCCDQIAPVTMAEVRADRCLVLWPHEQAPDDCHRSDCPVQCKVSGPPTRVVGRNAEGQCAYQSECETAGDCVFTRDQRRCCDCGAAYPVSLTADDKCLLQDNADNADTQTCPSRCEGTSCPSCQHLEPASLTCLRADPQVPLKSCMATQDA